MYIFEKYLFCQITYLENKEAVTIAQQRKPFFLLKCFMSKKSRFP